MRIALILFIITISGRPLLAQEERLSCSIADSILLASISNHFSKRTIIYVKYDSLLFNRVLGLNSNKVLFYNDPEEIYKKRIFNGCNGIRPYLQVVYQGSKSNLDSEFERHTLLLITCKERGLPIGSEISFDLSSDSCRVFSVGGLYQFQIYPE